MPPPFLVYSLEPRLDDLLKLITSYTAASMTSSNQGAGQARVRPILPRSLACLPFALIPLWLPTDAP
jgi:hypothetical protein